MHTVIEVLPYLLAMVVLVGCSAFFSASEAALFSLKPRDHKLLTAGNRSQKTAAALLSNPERLLSAILFWNLVINITYFALASIAGIQLDEKSALALTIGSLITIIILSEMVPKSVGVVSAHSLIRVVSLPLAVAIRVVDPIMPVLQLANLLSRRLLWPEFRSEPYLEVADLERAIQLSTSNAELVEQEQAVLKNIVALSEMRVDEAMRPRLQFRSFPPPVKLVDLEGKLPASRYLLITEPDSNDVASAISLTNLKDIPDNHLEHLADPVIYVPWFSSVADCLQQMKTREREVAAVVNEFGDTIGILTFEDILETIFTSDPTRSARLHNRQAIQKLNDTTWNVTGMTSLRRIARYFDVDLPESHSVTIAGVTHEVLERLPVEGDEFHWGPFELCVMEVPERGLMTIRLRTTHSGGEENS